jgi:hypothetical protein
MPSHNGQREFLPATWIFSLRSWFPFVGASPQLFNSRSQSILELPGRRSAGTGKHYPLHAMTGPAGGRGKPIESSSQERGNALFSCNVMHVTRPTCNVYTQRKDRPDCCLPTAGIEPGVTVTSLVVLDSPFGASLASARVGEVRAKKVGKYDCTRPRRLSEGD